MCLCRENINRIWWLATQFSTNFFFFIFLAKHFKKKLFFPRHLNEICFFFFAFFFSQNNSIFSLKFPYFYCEQFFFLLCCINHNKYILWCFVRYLWKETPGKMSMLALRAARFNAVIPLIDKHVTVSSLPKQLPSILRNDDDSSLTLLTPGAAQAMAKTADNTTNTFILIWSCYFYLSFLILMHNAFWRWLDFFFPITFSFRCNFKLFV